MVTAGIHAGLLPFFRLSEFGALPQTPETKRRSLLVRHPCRPSMRISAPPPGVWGLPQTPESLKIPPFLLISRLFFPFSRYFLPSFSRGPSAEKLSGFFQKKLCCEKSFS
jgi:hypothetical protein